MWWNAVRLLLNVVNCSGMWRHLAKCSEMWQIVEKCGDDVRRMHDFRKGERKVWKIERLKAEMQAARQVERHKGKHAKRQKRSI